MDELNETQRYFIEEHVEDYRDGLIARRELVRRVTLIAGSAALATTVLAACDLSPRAAPATSPTVYTPSASAGLVAQPYATPPANPTTDGITVKETDPRISVSRPDVRAADGASLMAYVATPVAASGRVPGVVVIHENRGQTEHIRDVVRRVATAGFVGINIDLAASDGGAADGGAAQEGRRPVPDHGVSRREPRISQRHECGGRPLQRGASAEGMGRDDRMVPAVPRLALGVDHFFSSIARSASRPSSVAFDRSGTMIFGSSAFGSAGA